MLVPELIFSLVMLHEEVSLLMHSEDWLHLLLPLLDGLEGFNKFIPGLENEDEDDIAWPGIPSNYLIS